MGVGAWAVAKHCPCFFRAIPLHQCHPVPHELHRGLRNAVLEVSQVITQPAHAVALRLHLRVLGLGFLQRWRATSLAGRHPELPGWHRSELRLILRPQSLQGLLHPAAHLRDIRVEVARRVIRLQSFNQHRRLRAAQVLLLPLSPNTLGAKDNLRNNRHARTMRNTRRAVTHAANFKAAGNRSFREDPHEFPTLG